MRNQKTHKHMDSSRPSFILQHANAIIFFLTFIISTLIFAIITFAFLLSTTYKSTLSNKASASTLYIDPSINCTMLIAVNSTTKGQPTEILLLRLNATHNQMAVMPVPLNLQVKTDDGNSTLANVFSSNGISTAKNEIEKQTSIKINYTCLIRSDNLPQIISLFNGINYDVPEGITYTLGSSSETFGISSGEQNLTGSKVLALLSFSGYPEGSAKQYEVQAGLMKSFIQQKLSGYYLNNADTFFRDIFNLIDTNFSMNDLLEKVPALNQIASLSGDHVQTVIPSFTAENTDGNNTSVLSAKTISAVKKIFSEK